MIKVELYPNPMPTSADKAPYLWRIVGGSTIYRNEVLEAVAKRFNDSDGLVTEEAIENYGQFIRGLMIENAPARIKDNMATYELVVDGDFSSVDEDFDASKHQILIGITPNADFIAEVEAATVQTIVNDDLEKPRIDRVMSDNGWDIVKAGDTATMTGYKLYADAENLQKLVFVDKSGVENVCDVTSTAEQPIKIGFKLPLTAAEGKGHLTLFTKAGVEGGEVVTTNSKVVTALAATGPVITKVANMHGVEGSIGISADGETPSVITGVNFAKCTEVSCYWPDLDVTNATSEIRGSTETEVKVLYTVNKTGKTAAELAANKCTVTLKFEDGTSASYSDLTWTNA